MSKIISINPDLFSSSGGLGTRKKRAKSDIKIKVRSAKYDNNKTTKRALLKYIRNQQEKNFEKNMKTEKMHETNQPIKPATDVDNFNTDFDESLKYLTTMAEQNSQKVNNHNHTLRRPTISSSVPLNTNSGMKIYEELPQVFALNNAINPSMNNPINLMINKPVMMNSRVNIPSPNYGCLKNGSLPTYRNWKNNTQKHQSTGHQTAGHQTHGHPMVGPQSIENIQMPTMIKPMPQPILGGNTKSSREHELDKNLRRMSEIKQSINKNNQIKKQKLYYPKQKRTLRRTYTVGKSAVFPKISVLISNKTIRNDISTKTQLLKQVPIGDVKKYLIKHGFIRVGTVSPNDVLRKMYESAILICGNINNHNPDNLLYNYLNTGTKDSM
jgi:hypothetical protein